jgi:shikimate 5-dehydrogenase
MSITKYAKAEKPTLYFIGVTTTQSSIMTVFPEWAKYLEFGDCMMRGVDLKQHDDPRRYREIVEHIKNDELSLGALVTTHKIDLLKAARDQFDEIDEYAELMGEISCISKRDGRLIGHAKDPITSGLALEAFLPESHWAKTGGEAFLMGAGGSTIASTWYMMRRDHGANRPSKIIIANRSTPRLEEIERLHGEFDSGISTEYYHTPQPELSDAITKRLKPHSLVVNATGLGKDWPGSPITNAAEFPQGGLAWEFNYRGDLLFLDQARAQREAKGLLIEDGWLYFIHGWTRVIAEVFHVDIPVTGPVFDELCRIAAQVRK